MLLCMIVAFFVAAITIYLSIYAYKETESYLMVSLVLALGILTGCQLLLIGLGAEHQGTSQVMLIGGNLFIMP